MFKKIFSIILRVVLSCATLGALYFTISTPTSVEVPVDGLVKTIVDKGVAESGSNELQSGMKFFRAIGAENAILNQLPKKIKVSDSYQSFYHLTSNYKKNGELEASDLGLKGGNSTQKSLNDLIMTYVNSSLSENKANLNQVANNYKILYFVIIGLYILAIVLILFGKKLAVVPLLISSIGSYALITMFAGQVQTELQQNVYSGIHVITGSGYSMSVILAIIISVVWLIFAKVGKNKKIKIKEPQGKHAA